MSVSPLDYLRHIRDEAHYLSSEASRITKSVFDTSETIKRAFVRSIEIIGEAAKKVPADLRQRYPHDIQLRHRSLIVTTAGWALVLSTQEELLLSSFVGAR